MSDETKVTPEGATAAAVGSDDGLGSDPGTPVETQSALADIWLCDDHEARKVMRAFKLGVREGRRQAQYADPEHHSTVKGTLEAFKEIMRLLPDEPNAELSDRSGE